MAVVWPASAPGDPAGNHQRLSKIGPAPGFSLTTQDGGRLSLKELQGRVVVVTFIYASCADTCPLLTAKLAALAPRLAAGGGPPVHFVAITVDPERDTPDILKHYGARYGVDGKSWTFLTGSPAEIREVARRYGVYVKKTERGDVDHTFLTSLIDPGGVLRVQYMGVRFDPEELLRDLQWLRAEARTP
ncbi:MAG TPA: SCO family protein [Methylomirabilota bacterium]|nr:SCO family protein [Methylomirabilota bacterium]